MAAATNNPMASGSMKNIPNPSPVSSQTYHIAGIQTTVHGLEEIPSGIHDVAVLWLLHPRLQKAESMAPVAASMIQSWYSSPKSRSRRLGLICAAFDQRNHGGRMVDKLANEAWRQGNSNHAMDMFSIYHGTAQDTSLLISYLSSYVFPTATHSITTNLVLGVSLGGHAAWHSIMQDSRISAAIIVIGCPDYIRLMSDRARLSKLPSYTSSSPPGKDFLGSKDFPRGLVEAVEKYDPAGLLLGELDTVTGQDHLDEPSEAEKTRLRPIMRDALGGKRILCLSGGADKLVPYRCGEPFMQWLKSALRADGGWFNDRGTVLQDIIDSEAGHEYTQKMRDEAARFVIETLGGDGPSQSGSRTSKI